MARGTSPPPPEIRSPAERRGAEEGAEAAAEEEEEEVFDDAFDIPTGVLLVQAALVLNASRRFRYTLDLKKEAEKEEIRRKIQAHAQVIRAAFLFKEAEAYTGINLATASRSFPIELEKLITLNRDHDSVALQEIGGVKGMSDLLKSDIDRGISPNEDELSQRRNAYGANTYPRKKRKNILDAIRKAPPAAISLTLGMTTEGVDVMFQHLNEEKQNIQVEVIRGGKRFETSIFDLVGDVVPLKIGDQVPADGVLISGHSLAIDESSMTGESKIVHKDQKAPFLMSGCKVADGYGSMLVTDVGTNIEWGQLMAKLSEDNGEETPLQVRLNGVATFIGMVGLSVAGAVLVVLWIRYFTGHTKNPDGTTQFVAGTTSVKQAFMGAIKILTIAVTIVAVAVPEGLPLAVTLTLAYSMRKMMRDKALVRRLSSCETRDQQRPYAAIRQGLLP
ncbi:hypothetical protein ACP70R_000214 [Stipagrostis hirtigluma subsp. patula]